MDISTTYWRKCSSCKKEIPYRGKYYLCSVSTCNRKRTGLVFCSMPCYERHLPGARHRDSYATEEVAPTIEQWKSEQAKEAPSSSPSPTPASTPTRRIIPSAAKSSASGSVNLKGLPDREILVVASKVKDYIRRRSEMNTSAGVLQALSDRIRRLCDDAIDVAAEDGRKTVMDKDFR